MLLQPGSVIDGKYQIERLLGEGGMGAVYAGLNTLIRKRVAIKVLHASVADSAEAVARFEREAQVAGRVGNDHILEIVDLGNLPDGDYYMVMEFLDGETLAERLRRSGKMSPEELIPLVCQALEGLAAAHAAGVVHRDLKPDNVFILRELAGVKDFVKLIDFGISKFKDPTNDVQLTQDGAMMGTPYYMSPEQARAKEVDQRADIYAMGVIMFECLSGSVPFEAKTFNQLLYEILMTETPALSARVGSIDPRLEHIVHKAMARDPADRYQSAGELLQTLRGVMSPAAADTMLAPAPVVKTPTAHTPVSSSRVAQATPGAPHTPQATSVSAGPRPTEPSVGLIVGASIGGLLFLGGTLFVAYRLFLAPGPEPDIEVGAPTSAQSAHALAGSPPAGSMGPVVAATDEPLVVPIDTPPTSNEAAAPSPSSPPASARPPRRKARALPVSRPVAAETSPATPPAPSASPTPTTPAEEKARNWDFGY